MEPAEVAQDESWSSFSAAALVEESEFMAQLLGPCQFSNEQHQQDQSYGLASIQWSSDHAADSCYCSSANSNVCYWFQGDEKSTDDSLQFAATPGYEIYYNLNESGAIPAANAGDIRRDSRMLEGNLPSESCKKKTRASANVTKSSKKARSERIHKSSKQDEDEENDGAANGGQSSCSYSSEDDSHASQEQNGGGCTSSSSISKGTASLDTNGKTRAGRGSGTDPQSLYARKRRERINERLKILQNLVPNGTKVDISTMLEEAVQYVKFLQLQIKLLSSDELWMYAPIAYNGMNIGLDLKISPPQ